MRARLVLLLCGCWAQSCTDHISRQEYAELVGAARACGEGDSCVPAGAGECTCPMPVNAAVQAQVDEAAARVDCQGAFAGDGVAIDCTAHTNVRCEAGRCISDESEGPL